MKFYNSVGPNPHAVRMFMKEKGIEIPQVEVDIRGGENRQAEYLEINANGQCPALEIENGKTLSEITALCEYLEEKHPEPALIGSTPEERAEARMWARRVDIYICEPMAAGFRFGEGDLRVDVDELLAWTERLVGLEENLTPEFPGSLYVRPLIFADEIGLRPSVAESYTLLVMVLPVEHYFSEGSGLRLVTETELVRAVHARHLAVLNAPIPHLLAPYS